MQSIGALRSKLYNAIYGQDSIVNGETISNILAELENRSDEMLPDDLESCRAAVEQWYQTWFPTGTK